MHALSASGVLEAWERGLDAGPVQRGLEMLHAVHPESDLGELASLSAGARDLKLVRAREATFGPCLKGLVPCTACGEQIEITFDSRTLGDQRVPDESEVVCGPYEVRMRAATSSDLMQATDPEIQRAREQILRACTLTVRRSGEAALFEELPVEVLDAIEAQLAEMDPLADIRIVAECPACGAQRSATFDVVSFFWREIEAWAQRLLREVHTLAAAYGWRERDILELSPLRRQCYLELVGA